MIEVIEIIGYQSHKHSVLELSPGVNILIGESDHGKSAINRALRWVFCNKPLGDEFRNWYLKVNEKVEVAIQFDDDSWIVREKGKNVNQYLVHNLKEPLKAIRSDVPNEVFEISKINELNLQRQSSWFLLDEKPGAVARQFNELAELGVMDSAIQIVNERVRNSTTRKKIYEEKVEEVKKKIKQLDEWLIPATKEMDRIELKDKELFNLYKKEKGLTDTIWEIEKINDQLDNLSFISKAEKALDDLINLQNQITSNTNIENSLRTLTESIGTVRSQLDAYADINKIEKALNELVRFLKEIRELEETHNQLAELVVSIEDMEQFLETCTFEIKKLTKQINKMFTQLGKCPLCERSF